MWIWLWLAIIAIGLAVEILSMEMITIWFSFGSFVALILALAKVPSMYQIITCVVLSLILLFSFRGFAQNLLEKIKKKLNIGQNKLPRAKLIWPITEDNFGIIRMDGQRLKATTEDGKALYAGARVEVVGQDGKIYIVRKLKWWQF